AASYLLVVAAGHQLAHFFRLPCFTIGSFAPGGAHSLYSLSQAKSGGGHTEDGSRGENSRGYRKLGMGVALAGFGAATAAGSQRRKRVTRMLRK
ncbi:unnamed protein product, partial [Polarella glacialis]